MNLEQELKDLPDAPGVYILYDANDTVIYVGKARSLKKRVPAHFRGIGSGNVFSPIGQEVTELEYMVTANESEALVLEDNMIKRHKPRYNIRLKDDKSFPYVRITLHEEFPRIEKTRTLINDGSRYIGPYSNVKALDGLLKSINRIVPIATCKPTIVSGKRKRACLKHDIGFCTAPCIGKIEKDEYAELVQEYILMLTGQHDELEAHLQRLMAKTSEAQEFEKAARYRDRLRAVQRGRQAQRATYWNQLPGHRDVLGLARTGPDALIQLLVVREGRVIGQQPFPLSAPSELPDATVVEAFLKQYYLRATEIPEEVIISVSIEETQFLEDWLTERRSTKQHVKIIHPTQDPLLSLIQMANENAQFHLHQLIERMARDEGRKQQAYTELMAALDLFEEPGHIEGFDISTLQGTESVGVCVVFKEGLPYKKGYRRFKIREVEGQDDFAMMHEVVQRRYRRVLTEGQSLPNLIVIDGGRGQLSMALKALNAVGAENVPILGLAKAEKPNPDIVYVPSQKTPIKLPADSQGLRLLQRVRDEAHRFAIAYHRKVRQIKGLKLTLTDIPGVGVKRATLLLQHFGNREKLSKASVDEIAAIPGITKQVAKDVAEHFSETSE
ncbi:MAG: excinuclease ABC subunit UvrC [Candidatus Hermodarchaeia archaeon]|jgi:excinuclease ABC subunit C